MEDCSDVTISLRQLSVVLSGGVGPGGGYRYHSRGIHGEYIGIITGIRSPSRLSTSKSMLLSTVWAEAELNA